jgi:uncharacterized surface protein with fasciclin (FAS1) repeats
MEISMPRKTLAVIAIVLAGLLASAIPAQATGSSRENIVGVVVGASGAPGTFDHNPWDYDILRDAVIAAGLADALSGPGPFTVFAPNDYAFIRTAADLGIRGSEAEVLAGLAGALGDKLDDVLLYHVAEGRQRALSVLRAGEIETLNGQTFAVRGLRLIDKSELNDPWLNIFALNMTASNGVIHGITRVLLPDLAA